MYKQPKGNGELEIIKGLRLCSMINISLFILPFLVFMPLILAGFNNLNNLYSMLKLLTNPFALIFILSFIFSVKYLVTKDVSKFTAVFLMVSTFVNFFMNLMSIGFLNFMKAF